MEALGGSVDQLFLSNVQLSQQKCVGGGCKGAESLLTALLQLMVSPGWPACQR